MGAWYTFSIMATIMNKSLINKQVFPLTLTFAHVLTSCICDSILFPLLASRSLRHLRLREAKDHNLVLQESVEAGPAGVPSVLCDGVLQAVHLHQLLLRASLPHPHRQSPSATLQRSDDLLLDGETSFFSNHSLPHSHHCRCCLRLSARTSV